MAGTRKQHKPTFRWQAMLILLPVVVLAAFGVFSLRQDKILAQHDATERAQFIADDLVQKIWTAVTTTNQFQRQWFQLNNSGELVFPPPFDDVPIPKPVLSPEDSIAVARFDAALRLIQEKKFSEAASAFDEVIAQFPSAVGESGLPLQPLALWKLLELPSITTDRIAAKYSFSANAFYSNAVFHPTPLTPYFLRDAPEDWQALWQEHERSRKLFLGARNFLRKSVDTQVLSTSSPSQMSPRLFWFEAPIDALGGSAEGGSKTDGSRLWLVARKNTNTFDFVERHWLAARFNAGSNHNFVCYAESVLGSQLAELMANRSLVPEYFGLGLELAGKEVREFAPDLRQWHYFHYAGKSGGDQKEYLTELDPKVFKLATEVLASAAKTEAGAELLKVKVYLTSPTTIYERQRERTFWFGWLIALSIAAALIGLAAAWGAFNRQQQLGEMKSNFVSSVSHELRAPIASVRLMAESLERGKVSEPVKQNEYFGFIVQECRRLSSLIENVLDFSRIEQGRKQYEFEPTDITSLVELTVKHMEPCAVEKGVRLEWETSNIEHPTPNIELKVDGRAIQQALVNLIDNAIKHSPKGETVTVGLACPSRRAGIAPVSMLPPGDSVFEAGANSEKLETGAMPVLLSVTDHGPGIPASERERIFERFHRLGSELRRETQGVGIGLSIVKHIVAAHGGRVRVESEVGKGSRFTIELPMNNAGIEQQSEE